MHPHQKKKNDFSWKVFLVTQKQQVKKRKIGKGRGGGRIKKARPQDMSEGLKEKLSLHSVRGST